MARLEDKIAEIPNAELRQIIDEEVKALKKKKQFGLVFEPHSPEVVLRHRAAIKRDVTVAKNGGKLAETWQVLRVHGQDAEILRTDSDGKPLRETVPVDSLVVVHRMAEPIYPALTSIASVQNGDPAQPHHILIEADNYHALQLLTYAYAGKVDCIYIDPPYNTGARDWKYNNDYVDGADGWRHSKWLTFMEKRLQLARRLLNPRNGVLIVTIDDNEFHHLRCLISELFAEYNVFNIVIEHNKRGRQGEEFAKTHEYAIVVCPESKEAIGEEPTDVVIGGETRNLRRTGNNSLRSDCPNQFYPIWVNPKTLEIVRAGTPLTLDAERDERKADGMIPIWPVDKKGVERNWYYGPDRLMVEYKAGKVFARKQSYGIHIYYTLKEKDSKRYKTVWSRPALDASTYGSELLNKIFGASSPFSYPKSLYAVRDSIATACLHRKSALIVDFFAGSGTTLNAVNLLNAIDGGQRQCILVTNNEVSEDEARRMGDQGLQPGDAEWDAVGICRSVTWPRNKFTILGKRDDGTVLEGEYQTGRTVSKDKARNIRQLGFAEGRTLTLPQRKQLVALMPDLPQSKLEADAPWFLDAELPVSVLWDVQQSAAWLEELADADHLTDIYVATTETKLFNALAKEIKETLGPLTVEEDEKRPMAEGFAANLDYFKLEFLEPSAVAMGRQFEGILPILWMMAGARGPRPEPPENGCAHLHWLIPPANPFAVLMRETRFREFFAKIEGRDDLTHVFLVTNSDKAFHDMKADLPEHLTAVQLYKSYLDNFKINTQRV